jgi:hypothetical protein
VGAFISIMLLSVSLVAAYELSKSGKIVLLAEQHWETYGVGGTCISGSHNLFVADVDGDGVMEVITGGFMYWVVNGSRTSAEAPLKIWSWDGQNIMLKEDRKWPGGIRCIYVVDADGDGVNDVFTGGTVINETGSYSSLRFWHWGDEELSLKAVYEGVSVSSIFVSDLDNDGKPEIVTVGSLSGDSQYTSQLCLWHLEQDSLVLKKQVKLANVNRAVSVYAYDLNDDGTVEIITAGYAGKLENSRGQLCVWHWNGEELTLKADREWQLVEGGYALNIAGGVQGNTMVNNVKVGDVDGDGAPEIITGGFTYDGKNVNAQLRVWNWDGESLRLEASEEWASDYLNEVKCISLNDVDGDSRVDIVTSGMGAAYGSFADPESTPSHAQLRVWCWDGKTLALKYSQDWTIGDGVCAWNIATGDLNKDGVIDIVTVGCMSIGTLCDPDMRIWSIVTPSPIGLIIATVISIIVTVLVVTYILAKKIPKNTPAVNQQGYERIQIIAHEATRLLVKSPFHAAFQENMQQRDSQALPKKAWVSPELKGLLSKRLRLMEPRKLNPPQRGEIICKNPSFSVSKHSKVCFCRFF